jgi:hypothetical protein
MNMQIQHPWMDNMHHVVFGGRWKVMWILMVEEKLFFEDDKVN